MSINEVPNVAPMIEMNKSKEGTTTARITVQNTRPVRNKFHFISKPQLSFRALERLITLTSGSGCGSGMEVSDGKWTGDSSSTTELMLWAMIGGFLKKIIFSNRWITGHKHIGYPNSAPIINPIWMIFFNMSNTNVWCIVSSRFIRITIKGKKLLTKHIFN